MWTPRPVGAAEALRPNVDAATPATAAPAVPAAPRRMSSRRPIGPAGAAGGVSPVARRRRDRASMTPPNRAHPTPAQSTRVRIGVSDFTGRGVSEPPVRSDVDACPPSGPGTAAGAGEATAGAATTNVPIMAVGWTSQWKWYLPAGSDPTG